MLQACKDDNHEDALALLCVSKMVRKDMHQRTNSLNIGLDNQFQNKSAIPVRYA